MAGEVGDIREKKRKENMNERTNDRRRSIQPSVSSFLSPFTFFFEVGEREGGEMDEQRECVDTKGEGFSMRSFVGSIE